MITAALKLLKNTLPHIHTNTLGLVTHGLITGANLVKTITQLIESCLADECIKHTHTPTQRKRAYSDVFVIYEVISLIT